jgi:CPA2 family monovalent cation:H+ antiporter-2
VAERELLLDIFFILGAAFLGGALLRSLRLPPVLGFIAAGLVLGPGTPGPVSDVENVRRAADLGVIMLMFSVGIQFSFSHLIRNKRVILVGGGIQIASTIVLGLAAGQLLGLSLGASLIVGFFAANTSTVIATKILAGTHESGTDHAAAATNVSILQDISAVIMIIAVPSLAGDSFPVQKVALAIPTGLALVGGTYLLSTYFLPVVWQAIARGGSREVSLLAGVVLAVGLAAGSASLGLSIAFGAFLAGVALSENRYGYLALSDIIPLRELFTSVFFVAMGMLIVPDVIWEEPLLVAGLVVLVVVVKGFASTVSLAVAGLNLRSAVLAGVLLSQVGEFSFVIASQALDEGVISQDLASAFLMAAVISILASSGLFDLALRFMPSIHDSEGEHLSRHTVICGYDRIARAVVRALSGRGIAFVVVDTDPGLLDETGIGLSPEQLVFGDPTQPEILAKAGLRTARVLAITGPYARTTSLITAHARSLNPHLAVVALAAAPGRSFEPDLVNEVVDPSIEGNLELLRHVLQMYGVDEREIRAQQSLLRAQHNPG